MITEQPVNNHDDMHKVADNILRDAGMTIEDSGGKVRRPGEIAAGKVESVIKYTGEGQVVPGAELPKAVSIGSKGYLAVRIQLDDEQLAKELPLGAAGSAAIYTNSGKSFHVFSKIAIRIKMWMNYLPKWTRSPMSFLDLEIRPMHRTKRTIDE